VKFYGVRETDLFHWYYLNGVRKTPFAAGKLREIASAAADILGPYVYGGDAIIGVDGSITVIDINDWPSFAPVREEASRAIAGLVFRKAQHYLTTHA
jgi:glutathione synthase/RimK-type ligase-like ATP-grasp enzyme